MSVNLGPVTFDKADVDRLSSPKVAFVLSGGGARGAFQVGMAQHLFKQGIKPNIVTGVSIGAINAYFIAQHNIEAMYELWTSIKKSSDIITPRYFAGPLMYLGLQFGQPSLYKPGPVSRQFLKQVKKRKSTDFKADLRIGAVNLTNGQYTCVGQTHPLLDCFLEASTAIPALMPAVSITTSRWCWHKSKKQELKNSGVEGIYVDGSVRHQTPIEEAINLGAQEVHVLLTNNCVLTNTDRSFRSWKSILERTIETNMNASLAKAIQQASLMKVDGKSIKIYVYEPPTIPSASILDFQPKKIKEMMLLGAKAATKPLNASQLAELYSMPNLAS